MSDTPDGDISYFRHQTADDNTGTLQELLITPQPHARLEFRVTLEARQSKAVATHSLARYRVRALVQMLQTWVDATKGEPEAVPLVSPPLPDPLNAEAFLRAHESTIDAQYGQIDDLQAEAAGLGRALIETQLAVEDAALMIERLDTLDAKEWLTRPEVVEARKLAAEVNAQSQSEPRDGWERVAIRGPVYGEDGKVVIPYATSVMIRKSFIIPG